MPTASTRHLAPWDEEAVGAMVRAAVDRKRNLFIHFRDLSEDDLVQEVLIAARKAYPTYDPARATLSTFIGAVAHRTLLFIHRGRARGARREGVYAEATWGISCDSSGRETSHAPIDPATPLDSITSTEADPAQTLAEWLRAVYLTAKRTHTSKRFRQGRRFHNVAQVIACVLLMDKKSLSTRGVVELFKNHPEMARAVHFLHVPDQSWFVRAREVASVFLNNSGRPRKTRGVA